MGLSFRKATKTQSKLRLALTGLPGSGKTYSALRIAKGLGARIAVIDTEAGSASKYAGDVCDFDVLELNEHAPRYFVQAIKLAEAEGYDVIVIDSLSHEWVGKGGALEMVDDIAERSKSKNAFAAWRFVTPEHRALIDAILQSTAHVIVTMRVKTEYAMVEERGKQTPQKVGMAVIQRESVEYEFDVIGDLDQQHVMRITKSRCPAVDNKTFALPGEEFAALLKAWLSDGAPPPPREESVGERLLRALQAVRTRAELGDVLTEAEANWLRIPGPLKVSFKALREEVERAVAEAEEAERALGEGGSRPFVADSPPPAPTSSGTSSTSHTSTTASTGEARA